MTNNSKIAAMSVHPRLKSSDQRGQAYRLNVEFNEYQSDRKTLVLLHGYLGSIEDYEPAFDKLAGSYNLIAIDLRGHGKSEVPLDEDVGWSMEDLAIDVMQIVSMIAPEAKVSLIGSSMSTAIALELAKMYPSVVEDLFLISPTTKFTIPGWVKLVLNLGKISPRRMMTSMVDFVGNIMGKLAKEEEKDMWEDGLERFQRMGLDIHKKIFEETLATWEVDASQVHQPVFVIAGIKDKVVPYANTLDLLEDLPNASLLSLEQSEHRIIRSNFDLVFDLVDQWISETELMNSQIFYTENDLETTNGKTSLRLVPEYLPSEKVKA